MTRLEGKVAIITGAGAGQGRAGAVLFAAEGAGIVAIDIDRGAVHHTVGLIDGTGGRDVAIVGDVADPDVHQRVVEASMSYYGALQILYCNAGMVARHLRHERGWNGRDARSRRGRRS